MKKAIALLLVLTLCSAGFAGCSGGEDSPTGKREISPPGTSQEKNQDDLQDESQAEEDPSTLSVLPEGTISSLDEIKQNAISSGYKTTELEKIQKEEMEKEGETFVGGFNIIIGSTHIPVMEFATPNDAQLFADFVNEAGYNVAIVNGRFLTSVDATKGIIKDEQLQADLEKIMDAKAQVQDQWSDTEDVATDTTDYKSAFALLDNINKFMNTLLQQSLTKNNKTHPMGDPQNTDGVIPLMFGLPALGFTAYFGEDESYYEGIVSAAEIYGIMEAKVTRNATNDYTLSGKEPGKKLPYEINGIYDPATRSLRMVEKTDGTVTEFLEFVPLEGDQYAFQTSKERAIVIYKNGKLESFTYTKISYGDTDYNSQSDSIYYDGMGATDEWVASRGEDGYEEFYSFTGKSIKLNVNTFSGRVKVEIPV